MEEEVTSNENVAETDVVETDETFPNESELVVGNNNVLAVAGDDVVKLKKALTRALEVLRQKNNENIMLTNNLLTKADEIAALNGLLANDRMALDSVREELESLKKPLVKLPTSAIIGTTMVDGVAREAEITVTSHIGANGETFQVTKVNF